MRGTGYESFMVASLSRRYYIQNRNDLSFLGEKTIDAAHPDVAASVKSASLIPSISTFSKVSGWGSIGRHIDRIVMSRA